MNRINISVPGRICLFGEHQDYLKLPVITGAINLRIAVSGAQQQGNEFFLDLPDINDSESFKLPDQDQELVYQKERDYFRSVFNVIKRTGIQPQSGFHCQVRGEIPINSGTSSSSALNIAWAMFLVLAGSGSLNEYPLERIAHLAYLAEVEEFGEPGGMMDHYATALGGTLFIEFADTVTLHKLKNPTGSFVLGDSQQPKDTKRILRRVKQGVLDAVNLIKQKDKSFDLKTCSPDGIKDYKPILTGEQITVLEGTLINRAITIEAKNLFRAHQFDHKLFGSLLNTHHEILDKKLEISTDKINNMLQRAINAGAYGGKINGSGGGGCMFVYAPDNTQEVKEAIEEAGGKAYIVNIDKGLDIEIKAN